jgi:hypothetical protein
VQSPAETATGLRVICLFRLSPVKTLQGSRTEMNEKLKGLLDLVRKPDLFRGELGETLLLAPATGSLGAKKLLIIGLGDSQSFTPPLMQPTGEILYGEASRSGVAQPIFHSDRPRWRVSRFTTGDNADQVIAGFLKAAATDKVLGDAHAATGGPVTALTYLAGAKNVGNTSDGIEKAIAAAPK